MDAGLTVILWDWAAFVLRWLHVITGIAWIGSSFYFIALDLGLRQREGLPKGAHGEAWQVHGGGFYHIQKYLVAPERMPEQLTWFKWESYSTWLSGFALLCVLYYGGAEIYMIDRAVMDLEPWQASLIGIGVLALGWTVYDLLCRSPIGHSMWFLLALFLFFSLVAFALTFVFSGRGAFIHAGALIATIMTANVFMIIIPNQRKVVAALIAGQTPDPNLGKQAKQRSLHNNYLTLPVVFAMLVSHQPLAFATEYNWAIFALVLVIGGIVRHFFNTMHGGKGMLWWCWAVAAAAMIGIIVLSLSGRTQVAGLQPSTDSVASIIENRCAMCHAAEPVWDGIATAPKNVVLDSEAAINHNARLIYLQAGVSRAMPPGNVTGMEDAERATLVAWFEGHK